MRRRRGGQRLITVTLEVFVRIDPGGDEDEDEPYPEVTAA